MVQVNVLGGYDNVTFPPGATAQSTVSALDWGGALESYNNSSAALFDPPQANSYVAWSLIPDDAVATVNHVASTHGQLTRIFVPANGPVGHIDFNFVAAGTTTVFFASVFTAAGVQVPGLTTAESHAAIVTTGLTPLAFTSSANLIGGNTYYVFTTITWSVQPTLAGVTYSGSGATQIAMANPNLTVASAPNTADAGVQATIPASLTMSGLTGLGSKIWCGLRA